MGCNPPYGFPSILETALFGVQLKSIPSSGHGWVVVVVEGAVEIVSWFDVVGDKGGVRGGGLEGSVANALYFGYRVACSSICLSTDDCV